MADNNERRPLIIIHSGSSGIFVGLFLIALGLVWLLGQQGILAAHALVPYFWPSIFVFFGLELLFSHRGESRGFGGFLFLIGAAMILSNLGYIPIHFGFATLWPILLVGIGVSILFSRLGRKGRRRNFTANFVGGPRTASDADSRSGPVVFGVSWRRSESTDAAINYFAVFSGIKQRLTSKNFKGGNIVAVWGGFQLDLTDAEMEGEEAVLDMTLFMGGGELRIPQHWSLEIKATAFMGAFRDETVRRSTPASSATKRLIIRGTAVMGGVVIKN